MTRRAKIYLGLVIAAGVLATAAGLRPAASEAVLNWSHLALLIGLALFATLLVVLRLFRPTRQATSGVGTLALFGALLLTAPQTVVLVLAMLAADVACRPKALRPPWFVIGFNTSALMLAALSAHVAVAKIHLGYGHQSAAAPVVATIPAVVAFFLISYGLVWGAHYFVFPTPGGFLKQLSSEGVEEAALLMIAALARAAWAVQPWLILLACGPLMLFWRLYRTVGRLEYSNNELASTQEQAIDGLVHALAARDNEVSGHSERVAYSTSILAVDLGIDTESDAYAVIYRGALLHDIGKISVRDAILHKPGKLTDDEWREMRDHSRRGYALVQPYPFLAGPASIVLAHHERWDGKGYPRGLAAEQIPFGARIFAVTDTFDAITSPRPYKPAIPIQDAVDEIVRCSGTQFDPQVVDAFLRHYNEFPTVQVPRPAAQAVAR